MSGKQLMQTKQQAKLRLWEVEFGFSPAMMTKNIAAADLEEAFAKAKEILAGEGRNFKKGGWDSPEEAMTAYEISSVSLIAEEG